MRTALLVEDNALNLKLLRDVLEICFEVLTARDAETALDLLRDHQPDLILTDLQLPGMSGLQFVALLKQTDEWKTIPVVAVSAHAMRSSIDEAIAAGCAEYVTKPIVEDPQMFAERMEKLIPVS